MAPGRDFSAEGLWLRTRLGTMTQPPPGYLDMTDRLARLPAPHRLAHARVAVAPGSRAHQSLVAAFDALGTLDAATLRALVLEGRFSEHWSAVETLARYTLLDFRRHSEPVSREGLPIAFALGPRRASLLHRLALEGVESDSLPLADRLARLAACGVDLDTAGAFRETPLMWAARAGSIEVARALVLAGADLHRLNLAGATALHVAAEAGQVGVVRLLAASGLAVDTRSSGRMAWTPLHAAAAAGQGESVRALVELGANPNLRAANDESALMIATRRRKPAVLMTLIEWGAAVNLAHGPDGITALHHAAHEGYAAEALVLLENGANPNARSRGGYEPLHYVGLRHGAPVPRVNIATALLSFGAGIDHPNAHGVRPVDFAGRAGNEFVFNYLVEQGAAPPHRFDMPSINP